jgi:hypothetical protein
MRLLFERYAREIHDEEFRLLQGADYFGFEISSQGLNYNWIKKGVKII